MVVNYKTSGALSFSKLQAHEAKGGDDISILGHIIFNGCRMTHEKMLCHSLKYSALLLCLLQFISQVACPEDCEQLAANSSEFW